MTRAQGTDRDLAAVGHQYLLEHAGCLLNSCGAAGSSVVRHRRPLVARSTRVIGTLTIRNPPISPWGGLKAGSFQEIRRGISDYGKKKVCSLGFSAEKRPERRAGGPPARRRTSYRLMGGPGAQENPRS
ncbi:hypothetical protein B005_0350 [Nocardiopsis alba ATCC BAA-2165]|uniref:Uncharacterized protein n=1 Tax=Nocardiopsis alba (strain ATCC BAA-2165 / BE74) TaxID=1205910 RepID=J7LBH5_NOCAA|nr:hypothetical protein B005_0350 [Nocardiopsis alba ATCC BAA-2165]